MQLVYKFLILIIKNMEELAKSLYKIRYIWEVVRGIIMLIIIFGSLSLVSQSKFETISVAILLLIYLSIARFFTYWAAQTMKFGQNFAVLQINIAKILNRERELSETDNKEYEDLKADVRGEFIASSISKIFNFLGYLLILVILILVLCF